VGAECSRFISWSWPEVFLFVDSALSLMEWQPAPNDATDGIVFFDAPTQQGLDFLRDEPGFSTT
jgi:hypothetical protein